jgi:hypothetical protein
MREVILKYMKILFKGCAILSVFCFSVYASEYPDYTRTDYPLNARAKFIFTGTENKNSNNDVIVVDWNGAINVFPNILKAF